MKKRFLALLLCLLMVLPMLLVSCGGGDDPDDTTNPEEDIYTSVLPVLSCVTRPSKANCMITGIHSMEMKSPRASIASALVWVKRQFWPMHAVRL